MISVGSFFRWWSAELAGMLPRSLRNAFKPRLDTLRLQVTASEIVVSHATNGHRKVLGAAARPIAAPGVSGDHAPEEMDDQVTLLAAIQRVRAKNTRVVIEPAPKLALSKVIEFPRIVAENLRQVLSFEMERQTPFRADEVYFNYRTLEEHSDAQHIKVGLDVVPQGVVDEALSLVDGWQIEQSVNDADSQAQEDGVALVFVPAGQRGRKATLLNSTLLVANAVLFVAIILIPLIQQRAHLDDLHKELEEAKAAAATVANIQSRVERFDAESRFVVQRKRETPPIVALLNELTALLPDETWLYRFEVKGGKVHLQGISEAASSLIARIEESGLFRKARFSSPVTQDGSTGQERFNLTADIIKSPADA